MCVNNLPRVAPESAAAGSEIRDLLVAIQGIQHYAAEPHIHSSVTVIKNEDSYN